MHNISFRYLIYADNKCQCALYNLQFLLLVRYIPNIVEYDVSVSILY